MYGPTVPATGGGLFAFAGLAAGVYFGNLLVIGISIALIAIIGVAIYRLRKGEKAMAKRDLV